ncbi:MAG: dephospho-CoA kinase [Flavobacteriaceae bacterium]|tara:strand:- start:1281 stop:1868 length:588 start_codon:yes stop_codon:yes gene_type:complete
MKVIGLTGGIGSGKSTVSKIFEDNGIPIYNSDLIAKDLMNNNIDLKKKMISSFGTKSYIDDKLNKPYISKLVFQNKKKLKIINSIVHPYVLTDFKIWAEKKISKYVIYESAIIFESGSYKKNDFNILVISDLKKRIERVMKRDKLSKDDVLNRIKNQWNDEKKIPLCDFVINNNFLIESENQTLKIIKLFDKRFN